MDADAVLVAYVEAKPNGFIFDVGGSRLEKNLMKLLVKNLSDQLGSLRLPVVCL